VKRLVELAKAIKVDSKARELRKFVTGVLGEAPHEKILIFTEYTDTLDFLRDNVLNAFGPVAQIHGGMGMEERQQQEEYFQQPEVHIMVATDAAGEGLNLQFCHMMINYELPWNPNRIEQRIGRLHRYGQEHDVRVYNLQVVNTREGYILWRLLLKIQTIEKQLGGYAPNILGLAAPAEAVNLNRLSELIMNAIAEDTPQEVTAEHIEQSLEARREMSERIESGLFMPLRQFHLGDAKKVIERSRKLTPTNDDIEVFARRYFGLHEGKIENTRLNRVLRLRTPRRLLDGRMVLDEYPQVTFDKETAFKQKAKEVQFIAFGHSLLEAMIGDCRASAPVLRGALTVKRIPGDRMKSKSGILFNYLLRYSDALDQTISEELVPVLISLDGQVDLEAATPVLRINSESVDKLQEQPEVLELVGEFEELERSAQQATAEIAQHTFERIQSEHHRRADASIQSLEQFQKAKADRLKGSITNYQQRLFGGEDMDIAIRRAQYELDRLDEECDRRRQQIEGRRVVQAHAPALLNAALLLSEANE
jgi:hypothetical protein